MKCLKTHIDSSHIKSFMTNLEIKNTEICICQDKRVTQKWKQKTKKEYKTIQNRGKSNIDFLFHILVFNLNFMTLLLLW